MDNQQIKVKLPSSLNVRLSQSVYDECYCNFDEPQWFSFNNFMNAGMYFPQIMQFIFVLIAILNGRSNWYEIILCNLIVGGGFTVIWYLFKFYKIPALSFICCFFISSSG